MKFNLKRSVLVVSSLLCVSYLLPRVDAQGNSTTTRQTTTQPQTSDAPTTTQAPTSTQAPPTTSVRPSAPPSSRPSQPATSTQGTLPPTGNTTCTSTAQCPVNKLCAITALGQVGGQCIDMPENICYSTPATSCSKNTDCNSAFFSYCATEVGVCAGLGDPARPETLCGNGNNQSVQPKNDGGSVMQTAKWAGIAVGCVAAFGAAFALVRWQRRRKRAKMPVSMFGEIDYGTDRPGPGSGGQYPFSNRNNAHGADSEYYDDAGYYDDGYGQNGNAHAMTGMGPDQGYYGNGGGYDAQNYDQGYYAKDGYDAGYGGAPGGGGGYDNGYYDQSGYNTQGYGMQQGQDMGYSQGPDMSTIGGNPGPVSEPPAAARALSPTNRGGYNATGDYSVDNYGVEPSELDFGGGQGGANQRYY